MCSKFGCWQNKTRSLCVSFSKLVLVHVHVHTLCTHSQSRPQGSWVFLLGHTVKWLICSVLLSGLWCDSGYWLGSKSWGSPPSPIITLLSPSTTADSQWVLLFCPRRRLLRDESLAELNRHTCVTPGYRALSLWSLFLTDGPFCFWALRSGPPPGKSASESLWDNVWGLHLNASVDVANCFTLGREFPAITEKETRWGRRQDRASV